MKETFAERGGHDLRYRLRTRTLAKDGDIVRITPQLGDIVFNPSQSGDLIEEAIIAGDTAWIIRAQRRVRNIAERSEAVTDCDQDNAMFDKLTGLVDAFRSRTGLVATAMDPYHHRLKV